jgi:hypothetical protein
MDTTTTTTTNKTLRYLFAAVICLLSCSLYYHFFENKAYVEIEIEVSQNTDFKIYWAGSGQLYSEKNMSGILATPNCKRYNFFLTNIGQVERLRIDTHRYKGEANLKRVFIQQPGWAPILLSTPKEFDQLVPLHHIIEYGIDSKGLMVKSTGDDPYFELLITPQHIERQFGWLSLRFAAISIVICLVLYSAGTLVKNLRFVPLLLFGVLMLITVMAGTSQRNAHPDEYVHLAATAYYRIHWLPPVVEDPEIRETYSVYGYSRLNNSEIYYLFAGKFDKLLDRLQLPNYFSSRIFNIFLFALLLLSTIKNRSARMVALPFLLSPQIWYLFSYCNSDAFALFCAFLVSCQIVDSESFLYHYLKDNRWVSKFFMGAILGILLGILFLLKKNYYPFILFFYLCLGLKLFLSEDFVGKKKKILTQLSFITLAGLLIVGLRIGVDYTVNGRDRQEKIENLQEELAHPWYKESTDLHKKHINLYRKARGESLQDIVIQDRWFERSFQTGFGVYGYSSINAPNIYYELVRWTGFSLLLFVFGSIFWRGGLIDRGLALSVLGLSLMLIGVSMYHSWTADFQAQGRYLFPIFSMLGILYPATHKAVNSSILSFGVILMYLLGIYSFIFQGLMYIPKIIICQ